MPARIGKATMRNAALPTSTGYPAQYLGRLIGRQPWSFSIVPYRPASLLRGSPDFSRSLWAGGDHACR
jgi:hypothetical protein